MIYLQMPIELRINQALTAVNPRMFRFLLSEMDAGGEDTSRARDGGRGGAT